ncbi:alpha-1,3-mannosyl-glycoprotein 2-beta-N-acetylglucosaminyltransferase b [Lepisosteus oculatus]|uniref:alpha-1,3-mannosyl-glycoprotein 2-beta-N-acetylglucosaminyltransferase b n=1 Tax=Lepisosteus oculatus TaxID=7918 RepID=UPI0035F50D99
MVRKKGSLILCGALLFVAWNALLLLFLWGRPPLGGLGAGRGGAEPGGGGAGGGAGPGGLAGEVVRLAEEVEKELETQKLLLQQIQRHRALWDRRAGGRKGEGPPASAGPAATPAPAVIPVLVIACDRPTVRRCLDKLLQYRPSAELHPIVVSQDCGHAETARVIASYGDRVAHLRQPDLSDPPLRPEHRKFQGYYRIARHYRWALGQVFDTLGHSAAIVVEDDLEVAPDFFEYFRALYPLLQQDPSLWCVSAWNDNGRAGLVDAGDPELLHRTDFFPGLGWLLRRELWAELAPKWPAAFWDDWMRRPEQRRGRACVRPEVSRTLTFGRRGVSLGQFFDQYLRDIQLNARYVAFGRLDLAYLRREEYDRAFERRVYGAPLARAEELQAGRAPGAGPVRVQYATRDAFKALAKALGVMDDLKSGVPRAGYRGVVSFLHRGRRVYLAPPPGWSGYDTTWS